MERIRHIIGPFQRLLLGVLLILLTDITVLTGLDQGWSSTPGETFEVLESTTAVFNWTHSIDSDVDIIWYFDGPKPETRNQIIMSYAADEQEPRIPRRNGSDLRLNYTRGFGSAVMTLSSVRGADNGVYRTKVLPLNESLSELKDRTELKVIPESILWYTINIDGMTFNHSVDRNGTNVTLTPPLMNREAGTSVEVDLEVNSLAPTPDIQILTILNESNPDANPDPEHCEAYFCDRKVPIFATYAKYDFFHVVVSIDFHVQNLAKVTAAMKVFLEKEVTAVPLTPPPTNETDSTTRVQKETGSTLQSAQEDDGLDPILVIVLCVLAAVVCSVILSILLICSLRKKKKVPTATLR